MQQAQHSAEVVHWESVARQDAGGGGGGGGPPEAPLEQPEIARADTSARGPRMRRMVNPPGPHDTRRPQGDEGAPPRSARGGYSRPHRSTGSAQRVPPDARTDGDGRRLAREASLRDASPG